MLSWPHCALPAAVARARSYALEELTSGRAVGFSVSQCHRGFAHTFRFSFSFSSISSIAIFMAFLSKFSAVDVFNSFNCKQLASQQLNPTVVPILRFYIYIQINLRHLKTLSVGTFI